MSNNSMRPSFSSGSYPEKKTQSALDIENQFKSMISKVSSQMNTRKARLDTFVKKVKLVSDKIKNLSDLEILQQCKLVGYDLIVKGFELELVASSFALVQEMSSRVLKMKHHDVQLMGGWIMMQGYLAEMDTGEGKTLTATLAASTAAFAKVPVHVITANEYLATRDKELMRPLYEALGLTVSVVTAEMREEAKREAYQADIVYCTNNQVAFDYLRDQMAIQNVSDFRREFSKLQTNSSKMQKPLLRGLCYAIVDEADSVLIDEARTPLIIAKDHNNPIQGQTYQQALEIAKMLENNIHYILDIKEHKVQLTDAGERKIKELSKDLQGLWVGKRRRRYLMTQALSALYLYVKDKHYLINDERIQIIDQQTGRVMPDRSWEAGMHQMIETKENCPLTGMKETLARITYQRFFRRYIKLSGMSGTLSEIENELSTVYDLNIVKVPTYKPSKRKDCGKYLFLTKESKYQAIVDKLKALQKEGRPALVGTSTVAESECLSRALIANGLVPTVLNARQDKNEADIIAIAGQSGRITVATNMAGRGTDIKISDEVVKAGGLHVICCEMNESVRIDRQLYGRTARQGDPGSFESILSLEDEAFELFYPSWLILMFQRYFKFRVPSGLSKFLIWLPQKTKEFKYRRLRYDLLKHDENLAKLLAFTGRLE